VHVLVDLSRSSAKLGAYEARLTWNAQVLELVKVADGETPAFASPQKRTRPDSLIFSDGEAEPASGLSGDGVRYVQ